MDEIVVESLAYGGAGVGRLRGKVVFLPLTAPGDRVLFRITREKKGYMEGEAVEIIEPSAARRNPPCPVFGECGGCSWQHLPYSGQRDAKEEIFRETLWRLGGVEKEKVCPIIPAPFEWGYRNRAQFKARFAGGRLRIGFYRRRSRYVTEIDVCPLMSTLVNDTMNLLKRTFQEAPFREKMPQVDVAVDDSDEKALVVIHLTCGPGEMDFDFVRKMLGEREELQGVYFQYGRKESLTPVFLRGDGRLRYGLIIEGREIGLSFSAGSFTQVNYAQNRRLVSEVTRLAGAGERILDLYCGIGNFTIPLALVSKDVVGLEELEGAVEDAAANAAAAEIKNCRFITGDACAAEGLGREPFDLVLVDPPRQGAVSVLRKIAEAAVPRIIYVSCNPATLARDLRMLAGRGYEVKSSRPVDMFPQTYHIESVTVIERKR